MASSQIALAEKPAYSPPAIDGDFYRIANVLDERGRALIKRVRAFTEGVVAPVVEEYWARDEFPFEIIPKMAEVGIGGVGYVKQGDQSWHYKEGNAEPLDVVNVTLQAVVPDSEENKQFFASTPSGQITLSILRPEAVTWFEKGKKYYVDFTSAQ